MVGTGEGEEVGPALGDEPVDGQDQPQHGDLLEVVRVLPAGDVLAGDVLCHRQVAVDELGAQGLPARVAGGQRGVLDEQRREVFVTRAVRGGGAGGCHRSSSDWRPVWPSGASALPGALMTPCRLRRPVVMLGRSQQEEGTARSSTGPRTDP